MESLNSDEKLVIKVMLAFRLIQNEKKTIQSSILKQPIHPPQRPAHHYIPSLLNKLQSSNSLYASKSALEMKVAPINPLDAFSQNLSYLRVLVNSRDDFTSPLAASLRQKINLGDNAKMARTRTYSTAHSKLFP